MLYRTHGGAMKIIRWKYRTSLIIKRLLTVAKIIFAEGPQMKIKEEYYFHDCGALFFACASS